MDKIRVESSCISVPDAFKASISARGVPSTQSSVMTLRPDTFQWIFGTDRSLSSEVFAANSDAADASSRRSSSPRTIESKCSITSSGRRRRDLGDSISIILAAK